MIGMLENVTGMLAIDEENMSSASDNFAIRRGEGEL